MPRCAVGRGGYNAFGEEVQLKSALTIHLCSAAEFTGDLGLATFPF